VSVAVTVLYFDGCRGWQTAIDHVHAAATATGIPGEFSPQQVETIEHAHAVGFTGSPTLLLDGTYPFVASDAPQALAEPMTSSMPCTFGMSAGLGVLAEAGGRQ
jgi:hypothetical protein